MFVLFEIIDGVRLTCIILVYVDDLLVVGSSVLTACITEMLKDRFLLTEGGGDYLGLEIDASPGVIHVYTPGELREESRSHKRLRRL